MQKIQNSVDKRQHMLMRGRINGEVAHIEPQHSFVALLEKFGPYREISQPLVKQELRDGNST